MSGNNSLVAENRQARFHYALGDTLEAGIVLTGPEVKSLRKGGASIAESYVSLEKGELWLVNATIQPYKEATGFSKQEDKRLRKLLVSKRELARLATAVGPKGMTIVPLKLYFNDKGRAKVLISLAKGKNVADKRETEAKRDWGRQKARLLKENR